MFPPGAIGIFGGSFNPVHNAHVALAKEIQKRCPFEKLCIMPSANPPHKPPYEIAAKHRLEMVRLAFAGIPGAEISTFEIESTKPSYTIHAVEHFRSQYPNKYIAFILGSDAFYGLPEWHDFPKVMEACSYLVVNRAGVEPSQLGDVILELKAESLITELKPQEPFERLYRTRSGTEIRILAASLPEISSTEIRLRLHWGETLQNLVPPTVEQYLKTKDLYGIFTKQ